MPITQTSYAPESQGIKSIQRGEVNVSGGNTTLITVSAVNMAKSVLNLLSADVGMVSPYGGSNTSTAVLQNSCRIKLSSSTEITAVGGSYYAGQNATATITWELVEYM
jgi:hypothetical protein